MSNPFGAGDSQPRRVRLPPIEGQQFRGDYDGGSGGNYQSEQMPQTLPKKSVGFSDVAAEEPERKKILYIRVLGTSALELDTNVMHPFVRIHILNMQTGCYIQKRNIDQNAVYGFESNCVIEVKENAKERRACELEFIPAFSTNCFDLRVTGGSRAAWNEEIFINEGTDYLYDPEVVILFELLDFNPMYLQAKKIDSLDVDYLYRIAWCYLRPFGLTKVHMGTLRLQFYRYVFDTRRLNQSDRKECTPLVYFDFIWPQKSEYNGVLNILYLPKDKPEITDVFECSKNVFEIERGDRDIKKKFHQQEEESEEGASDELTEQEKKNLRRRRFINESCQIPTKIEYKFASAPLGCYRLAFNRKGNLLAAACTYKSSKTIIKLFDVEAGNNVGQFKGHSNLIHDLRFSPMSLFLISVSSDQLAKVWRLPKHIAHENVQEDESDHYLVTSLSHPSYVYSGLFLSEGLQPLVVTACFDSRIRIWRTDSRKTMVVQQEPLQQEVISTSGSTFDNFEDLLDHRHPNCMAFDSQKLLYVGDSLGAIHVYDINVNMNSQFVANRIALVIHPEMQGDAINSLTLVPAELKDLLVHSRDNCLRILELNSAASRYQDGEQSTGSIVGRFFGTVTQKLCVRSTTSPCGEYIISGSEDGKPHLWDKLGLVQETDIFEYSLIGPVADVAWNETYHMVALAGFGDEHPIVVYVYELPEDTTLQQYKQLQEKLATNFKEKQQVIETPAFIQQQQQSTGGGPFSGGPFAQPGGSGGFTGTPSNPFMTGPFQNSSPSRPNKPF